MRHTNYRLASGAPATLVVPLFLLAVCNTAPAQPDPGAQDPVVAELSSGDRSRVDAAVKRIRGELPSAPRETVDRLNKNLMAAMLEAGRYDDVDELATAGSIAVARDTWQVEQLQRFRVEAFRKRGQLDDAVAAAKALFLVAGMGSAAHDIDLLASMLREAHPDDPALHYHFRLQQLAGAQEDPAERQRALAKATQPTGGELILAKVKIDATPYEKAMDERKGADTYDALYGLGNLLLLSGRVKEAREAFQRAYDAAPPTEINYATEALAKVLKAEDLAVGRANVFVKSIRSK